MAKRSTLALCHRCNNLDLDAIFFHHDDLPSSPQGIPLADINAISRNSRRALCKMCHFLASSTSLLDGAILADTWHLRGTNYDDLRFDEVTSPEIPTGKLVLTLVPGSICDEWPEDLEIASSYCILPIQSDELHRPTREYHGRLIRRSFDFDCTRQWIDNCLRKHGQCSQRTAMRAPPDLRVIDCETGSVVTLRGEDYVALSYCIGPRSNQSNKPRSINGIKRFPKVISNAVTCCRGLGYRYLWVDQICIDQTDPVAVADAISRMHQIYSASALTIVALGDTQAFGLPGIGSASRSKQACLRTTDTTYISTMASLPQAIKTSKWSTRAWCYQEAVLSKRLLFIGSDQAYFVCGTSLRQESVVEELPHLSREGDGQHTQITSLGLELRKGPQRHGAWDFGKWLETYTTRDFSFQSDILNAFRGILNISTHLTYWGIPLISAGDEQGDLNQDRAFAVGLSWATTYNRDPEIHAWYENDIPTEEGFYRRQDFPSWSWASCRVFRSPIAYKVPGDFSYEFEREFDANIDATNIVVKLEDEDGNMVPIGDVVSRLPTTSKVLPGKSTGIEIETYTFPFCLSRVRSDRSIVDDSGFGKFCIRVPGVPELDEEYTLIPHSALRGGAFVAPEDGRYLVDFDRPPTAVDQYSESLHQQRYFGLVLCSRQEDPSTDAQDEDIEQALDDIYCVLICQPHGIEGWYERVGLVWVEEEHLQSFEVQRQKTRLR